MCCGVIPILFGWFLRVPSLHALVSFGKPFCDLLVVNCDYTCDDTIFTLRNYFTYVYTASDSIKCADLPKVFTTTFVVSYTMFWYVWYLECGKLLIPSLSIN